MPRLVWANPANWSQQYVTGMYNDPHVPNGYFLTGGSDDAIDRQIWPDAENTGIQQYMAGVNSGGFPAYVGDPTARPDFPNGILCVCEVRPPILGDWAEFVWGAGVWGA